MSRNGPMVIEYTQDGRDRVFGGIATEDLPLHLEVMAEHACTVNRVYDGITEARQAFPVGVRVVTHGKWWGSTTGTVTADPSEPTWQCGSSGTEVLIAFDDGKVMTWWTRKLEVISKPGNHS